MSARKGGLRFFGIDAVATLYFDHDVLVRVKLVAEGVSEHSLDYVEDELRRLRLVPECSVRDGVNRVCDWLGAAHAHVEMKPGHLEARRAPGRPLVFVAAPGGRPAGSAGPQPARQDSVARPTVPPVAAPPPDSTRARAPIAEAPVAVPPNIARALGDTLDFTRPESVTGKPGPELLMTCTPVWPKGARASGVQGRVVVRVLVNTAGRVVDASITRGIALFNASALDCARAPRFKAYGVGDGAVAFCTEVPVISLLH